jgi:hypothetical protein
MKISRSFLLTSAAAVFFLLSSCELLTEKNNDCDKTQWQDYKELSIIFYIRVPQNYCDYPATIYFSDNADKMICSGSVTKVYCDGSIGGKFNFNTTFYPAGMDKNDLERQQVGMVYIFKFQNDKDHLVFTGRLKAFFPEDVLYESEEFLAKVFYENIELDVNNFRYFYRVRLEDQIHWYRVTGE